VTGEQDARVARFGAPMPTANLMKSLERFHGLLSA